MTIWDQVLARVETKVNRHSFFTWFRQTTFVRDQGERLVIQVPDSVFRDWVLKHYSGVLADALAEVGRPAVALNFITDTEAQAEEDAAGPGARCRRRGPRARPTVASAAEDSALVHAPAGLNARYTFDSFVVGPSNQFAHAACRAVAESPARSYNPLFIYGDVGLGKTHLMHAIGHYIARHTRNLRLTYVSSERFMNEMINALRYERILEFRERYRNVDVLLVDDVQFLSGKESTQTEFFHTFNALFDAAEADRDQQRLAAARDHLARRAAAIALRMGPDRRHPAARPRDQGRDPQEKGRRRGRSRCPTTSPSTSPARSSRTSASSRAR